VLLLGKGEDDPAHESKEPGTANTTIIKTATLAEFTGGLVAYYPFNGNANDESGNGHDGTVHGATLTTDRYGSSSKAYAFNGINQSIRASHHNDLNPAHFTLSAWINPATTPTGTLGRRIVSKEGALNSGRYGFGLNQNGQKKLGVTANHNGGPGGGANGGTTLFTAGQWYHVVGTYDGTTMRLYVNGISEDSANHTISLSSNEPLGIGNLPGNTGTSEDEFDGKIDDVRIYNRALSAEEVAQL
ncbi:uncharacterized protein METZ01_LOCUS479597, partial [marine metagenome]